MYTQCPECNSAFRVTAEVLKQAAGMVRCGSCGHAFNSLAYLSEKKPQPKTPDPSIPELVPEPAEKSAETPPEPPSGPQAISAEQSAALLKTLDQLAGDDIRIEDTGVEWRVLDDEDVDDEPMPDSNEHELLSDPELTSAFRIEDGLPEEQLAERATDVFDAAGTVVEEQDLFDDHNTMVDELLDEAPTPVDEFLAAEPTASVPADMVDLGALLDDLEPRDEGGQNGAEHDSIAAQDEPVATEHAADSGNVEDEPASEIDLAATVVPDDLDLDLDVPEPPPEPAEPELRFDDNTPLPEDFLDDDAPAPVAPAIEEPVASSPDPEALQENLEPGKADEWQALLDEFGDLLATDLESSEQAGEEKADDDWAELSEEAVDAELSRELEALGSEDDAVEAIVEENLADDSPALAVEEPVADDHDEVPDLRNEPEEAAQDEHVELAEAGHDEPVEEAGHETGDAPAETVEDPSLSAAHETQHVDESADDELAAVDVSADDDADDEGLPVDGDGGLDLTGILDPDDEGLEDHGESDAESDGSDLPDIIDVGDGVEAAAGDEPEDQSVDEPGPGHPHYVPPQSEEEQTINMLIDQDLLAIAHEDEDGFTSTIVFEAGAEPSDVDSIVMEDSEDGESANDDVPVDEAIEAESAGDDLAAASEAPPAQAERNVGRMVGLGVLAAVLLLALGAQAIHQKRAELATHPSFGGAVTGIYDALGMPVTPEWDVSDWRIEKTQGSTDDSGRLLTIFAQLGNQGESALPYPTITVSVTDRYQESLGSVIVDPADYLTNAGMANGSVAPGASFEATIPIAELSPNAEGYLLNACYRQPDGPLRCAKEDFR